MFVKPINRYYSLYPKYDVFVAARIPTYTNHISYVSIYILSLYSNWFTIYFLRKGEKQNITLFIFFIENMNIVQIQELIECREHGPSDPQQKLDLGLY